MSFWRKDVVEFALSRETEAHMREQKEWIAREPGNAEPWYNLAQLYRIDGRADEALALLLEAVRLSPALARAHVALAEMYAVGDDASAAWRHARAAEASGDSRAVDMLRRHNVAEA